MKVVSLGRPAIFHIPMKKWDNIEYSQRGKTISTLVDEFLVANYHGYTIRGVSLGKWRLQKGLPVEIESMMEVKASFLGKERIPKLQKFLSGICRLMKEQCLYLEMGEQAYLIYP